MQFRTLELPSILTLPFTIDEHSLKPNNGLSTFFQDNFYNHESTNIPYFETQELFQVPVKHQSNQINQVANVNQQNCALRLPKTYTLHKKGIWTQEEDMLLLQAVNETKPIIWDVVAEKIPGRNAIQCRERWRYRLDPSINRTPFQKWEDDFIISERKKVGNLWTLIATKLPGRTVCAVKNRWYSVLRHRLNDDDSSQSP